MYVINKRAIPICQCMKSLIRSKDNWVVQPGQKASIVVVVYLEFLMLVEVVRALAVSNYEAEGITSARQN